MKTNVKIISEARGSLHQKWSEVAMISLIYFVLNILISAITSFSTFVSIISILAIAPLHIGFCKYFLDLNAGIINNYNTLFRWFKGGYLRVVITYFMMSVYIALWTILLIIPGIIMSIAYSQVLFILAEDNTISPQKAINKSRNMMRGYKMKYFLLNLRFIGWIILSILTLGIGLIWFLPYVTTVYACFYNDLKENYIEDYSSCCC